MLPAIRALLAADATVTGLVSARVYRHGEAPTNVLRPYVTWSVAGGAPDNGFSGACADAFRLQVDCWSDTDAEIETLAEAVRDAIEARAHCVGYVANERDFETKRFRISLAFDWIASR
jgi:hypothetical protein